MFPDAQMPLYACGLDINEDGYEDIILIYAGEPKHRGGTTWIDGVVKAMMPHEFIEAMDRGEDK